MDIECPRDADKAAAAGGLLHELFYFLPFPKDLGSGAEPALGGGCPVIFVAEPCFSVPAGKTAPERGLGLIAHGCFCNVWKNSRSDLPAL